MTDVIIAPRVEDPLSDIEAVMSGAVFQLRASQWNSAAGQWISDAWSAPVTLDGAAVTVKLDASASVPYELYLKYKDGQGGDVERYEYRIVPASGTPVAWDSLTLVTGPSGAPVAVDTLTARVTALEATFPSGGASTLSAITDMSATAQTFNAQTSFANMRSTLGAGTSSLVVGTTTGTAADGGTVTTLTTTVGTKAPLASPTFTGTVTVPTATASTSPVTKAQLDTVASAGVADATTSTLGKIQLAGDLAGTAAAPTVVGLSGKAPLASPTFTGTPAAPTAALGTDTTQVATTAYVQDHTAWAYGVYPRVIWSGTAWPTRSSATPVGYTGAVEYWSAYDSTATPPTDRVGTGAPGSDLWTRKR